MLFSGLGFLLCSRLSGCFVVLFSSLSFLLYSRLSGFFVVLFGRLRFLLCSRFSRFVVFLMVHGFCWRGGGGSRCWRSGGFSSERSRRQTHSSGNNQS